MEQKPSYEELERRVQELEKIESDHKYSKEELQEKDSLFKMLYEKAPLGYQSLDENGHFIVVNQTWLDTLGYIREEVIGRSFADFLHPDWRDHFKENFPRFKSIGEVLGVEFEMVKKNGNVILVSFTGKISMDKNGDFQQTHCIFHDITERKRAEDALRRSEKDLRESQRIAHVGSWRLDVATNQVVWTEELYNMYGFDPSLPPPPYTEHMKLFTPESWDRLSSALAHTRDTGIPYTLELETVRKDGSNGWMWVRGEADVDSEGRTVELWGAAQDITERKRAETYRMMEREILQILNEPNDMKETIQRALAALKTGTGVDAAGLRLQEDEDFPYFVQDGFSKDFLLTENTLLERDKDGGVCRDTEGNVRLECTCGLVISGKTDPSNPLFTQGGSCWTNDSAPLLDLPSDQDPRLHPRNNCIHQGYASVALIPVRIQDQMYSRETCIRHGFSSMAQVPVRTSDRIVGLMQLNDKRKGRFTLEMIEILESIAAHVGSALIRKQAEEDLEKSLSLIDATMSSLEEGLLVVNMEGKIIRHNRAFLDLWKIPPELESSSDETLLEHVASQLADPEAFLSKVKQLYDAPEESSFDEFTFADGRVFERFSQPLWQGSQITGRIWCFRSITDRKQAEAEREKLQDQLSQAQKMESIGTLAGGIAHDFNNILYPLIGFTEMLKEDVPSDSPLHNHIDEILQASFRAKDLVKQILAFSRQGEQELRPIKLQPIIKEALKLLRSSIPTTIEIKQVIEPDCGVVVADPTQVHQILVNLATNAYQAMEETGGKLTVRLEQTHLEPEQILLPELAPGDYAMLRVKDTGPGIGKDVLDKIFDPYFTTKGTGKGTGLGLSVVQGIVKRTHGDIHIISEPGQGTEVQVYLPVKENASAQRRFDPDQPVQNGTEKVLLVDDEASIVKMEQQILERLGYTVTVRTGSLDALEAFKADPNAFDVVVTDMTMPNMTGVQLAAELKKIRPDIPVVLCTGFSYQVNDEKSKALGIDGFVMKPVIMKEIAATIRKVLDKTKD